MFVGECGNSIESSVEKEKRVWCPRLIRPCYSAAEFQAMLSALPGSAKAVKVVCKAWVDRGARKRRAPVFSQSERRTASI